MSGQHRDRLRPRGPEVERVVGRAARLEVATRRRLEGMSPGAFRSLFEGRGSEMAEIRRYQPGDDYRSIDWNVTARTGEPHVRRFEEERDFPLLLVADGSGSLDFGSRFRTKRELAVEAGALLAAAALREGHPVGQIVFTDRIEGRCIEPGRGPHRLRRLIAGLATPSEGRATDLSTGLEAAERLITRRSLVVVITDLIDPGAFREPLDRLALGHDVVFVEVRDRWDDRLPGVGLLRVRNPETGRVAVVDLASPAIRRRIEGKSRARRAEVHAVLEERGVDRVALETGDDVAVKLAGFFRLRTRRGP